MKSEQFASALHVQFVSLFCFVVLIDEIRRARTSEWRTSILNVSHMAAANGSLFTIHFSLLPHCVEGLFGEFHHFVAVGPRVQSAVHQRRGDDIRPMSQSRTEVIEAFAAIERTHSFAHQFLLGVGRAEVVELLAPQVDLVAQVHLRRAEGLTTVAECAGADVA